MYFSIMHMHISQDCHPKFAKVGLSDERPIFPEILFENHLEELESFMLLPEINHHHLVVEFQFLFQHIVSKCYHPVNMNCSRKTILLLVEFQMEGKIFTICVEAVKFPNGM